MADDTDDAQRTEEPTQRRLDDAAAKGDVVRSSELSTFILMSGATLALVIFAGSAANTFARTFTVFLERPEEMTLGGAGVLEVFHRSLMGLLAMLAPATLMLILSALGGHFIQNRPSFSTERLKPDLSKLSLMKGFKRLFGMEGIVNLIKGIAKISVVGTVSFLVLWPERARSRMMAAVPKATVVITNPTHYAVALSYESGKMVAPVVVAKGVDDVARRIRETAQEHGVPIVENPPLARALFAAVDIDETIPAEHFQAVAQIIGYVMRLAQGRKYWNS